MEIRESIDRALAKVPSRPGGIVKSNTAEVAKICSAAGVIFEIGAYNGFDLPEIHDCWPNAAIHCFEPDPDNFDRLREFESEFIVCNPIALSNKSGTVPFFRVLDSKTDNQSERDEWFKTAGSLRHNGPRHLGARPELREQQIDVTCMTVDQYCAKSGVTPAVMLIDTQGSEFEILEGATGTLVHVTAIILEWSTAPLYEGQKFLPEIERLLSKSGFVLEKQINLWENFHGDAIFVRHPTPGRRFIRKIRRQFQRLRVKMIGQNNTVKRPLSQMPSRIRGAYRRGGITGLIKVVYRKIFRRAP